MLSGFAPRAVGLSVLIITVLTATAGAAPVRKIKVPLDYDDPAAGTITLAAARLPARQPKRRIGALMINYGGPGADAVERVRSRTGARRLSGLRKRFDIVVFDPRGTGRSRPRLDCRVDQERAGIYRIPTARKSDGADRLMRRATAYATRCATRNARLAPHLSTANSARDLDRVRRAYGLRRVSYLGFSYGTLLGATYARLFPTRVRALVLDGPVNPDEYLNHPRTNLVRQTAAFENSLERFFAACRRLCRYAGRRSPRSAYDLLVRRANSRPLRVKSPRVRSRRPVTGDGINLVASSLLYDKRDWNLLAIGLYDAARRHDGSVLRLLLDDFYARRRNGSYQPLLDAYFMITAAEQQYERDPQLYFDAGAAAPLRYPHFFFNLGYAELNYVAYTPRDEDAYLGPFTLPANGPTPLVVAMTNDPATPYAGGRALIEQLGGGRLLTVRGDGHTAYGEGSHCVDRAVNRYLFTLRLPRPGASCRQGVPFPSGPRAATARAVR